MAIQVQSKTKTGPLVDGMLQYLLLCKCASFYLFLSDAAYAKLLCSVCGGVPSHFLYE